jgi:hypothetical protein
MQIKQVSTIKEIAGFFVLTVEDRFSDKQIYHKIHEFITDFLFKSKIVFLQCVKTKINIEKKKIFYLF